MTERAPVGQRRTSAGWLTAISLGTSLGLPPPGSFAAGPCAPLPPPAGAVVRVGTTAELEAAVASLVSGTTILVADGVYDLASTLIVRGGVSDVAVRGESGDRNRVVLRGRGMSNPAFGGVPHGFVIEDASRVLIADLTVRDVYYHNVQVKGERGANVRLYGVRLVDSGEQQVKGSTAGPPGPYSDDSSVECSLIEYTDRARSDYTNGVDVLAGARWTIRDNVFRNIRAPAGSLAGPAVLMWRNCLDTVVERNLFIECDRAVALGLSAPDSNSRDGETTYDHQGGMVRNNVVYRAAGGATGDVGITVNYARGYAVHHNTVVLNGTFPWTIEYRFAASNGELAYNLTDGQILRRDGATGVLTGNVTSALSAWFTDAAAGDLHLQASATAAIDRATPRSDVGDDFDGMTRPAGPAPDVGADEHGCALPSGPIVQLLAVRASGDVRLEWRPEAAVPSYNLWYVGDKRQIDLARLATAPPAVPVAGCAEPGPSSVPPCTDRGAVSRAVSPVFYQVRSFCGGAAEGP